MLPACSILAENPLKLHRKSIEKKGVCRLRWFAYGGLFDVTVLKMINDDYLFGWVYNPIFLDDRIPYKGRAF